MPLKVYNTATRSLDTFVPLEKGRAKVYACGPTIYDNAHIGNFRTFLFFDLVHRYLEWCGYDVRFVMNLTDVDDKTIARQEAVILSMTPAERRNSKILNASRRRRIAAGSGTSVQEVNRLLKQYQQMNAMMKKVGKMGKKGMARAGGLPPGFMPPLPPVRYYKPFAEYRVLNNRWKQRNVPDNPPVPGGRQEAPVLPHRGGRFPQPP